MIFLFAQWTNQPNKPFLYYKVREGASEYMEYRLFFSCNTGTAIKYQSKSSKHQSNPVELTFCSTLIVFRSAELIEVNQLIRLPIEVRFALIDFPWNFFCRSSMWSPGREHSLMPVPGMCELTRKRGSIFSLWLGHTHHFTNLITPPPGREIFILTIFTNWSRYKF